MKERNKAIPAVYLIIKKKNMVFLIRRAFTTYFDGYYSLPAGHVEAGELPLECMIREAKEEVGISITKKDLMLVHIMYRTSHDITGDRADYFFKVEKFEGELKNMEPNKCDDLKWFDLNKLPMKLTPEAKLALASLKKKVVYSEMPFDKKNVNPTKQH
jgi:8-oxo-dGTP diphosphatase